MKILLASFILMICYSGCESITEPNTDSEESIFYYTSPKIAVHDLSTNSSIESAIVEAIGYNQKKVTNHLGEVVFVFSFESSKGVSIEVDFCISHSYYLSKTVKMKCISGNQIENRYAQVYLDAD